MTQTKKKPTDDPWRTPWRHSYVTRPVGWCVSVWLGIVVIRELGVPTLWLALAATLTTLAAPLITAGLGRDLPWRWFTGLIAAVVGGYTVWVITGRHFQPGMWDWLPTRGAFLPWFPFGAGFGAWWWWLRALEFHTDRLEKAEAKQAEVDAERGRYLPILKRVLKKKPEWQGITEKGRIPFEAGVTLALRLPADGSITFDQLDQLTEKLEVAADVRPGSLLFEKPIGGTAAEVHLHVFERDVLAEKIPLPFDRSPKSIHHPIHLGKYATGDVCVVTFREVAALMVGLRGSGKSSLIHTHLAHLTGCVDAKVWMIDLKGGETVQPWLRPFLEAVRSTDFPDGPRPAVDWAAINPAEADAMLIAFNAAIQARTKANRGRKLKPSADQPAIILIVEEASLVTGVGRYGNIDRAGMLQDGVTTGRSAAADAMVCSQRATVDMIGNGSMKSNLNLRYGLGVVSLEEARMLFPDGNAARALARIPNDDDHAGAFLAQAPKDGARILAAKGYWIEEDAIWGIAITNAPYQPDLDDFTVSEIEAALSRAGVSGGYAGRWDRYRHELGYDVAETSQGGASETPGGPSQDPSQQPSQEASESRGAQLVREAVERHRREVAETAGRETDEEFERLMREEFPAGELAGETGGEMSPDLGKATPYTVSHGTAEAVADAIAPADPEVPPFLRLMGAVFAVRTEDVLLTRILLEHMPDGLTPTKLGRLANLCGFTSVENLTDPETGKRARGYRREDVARTLIEIGEGRRTVPPAAFDWTP